MRLHSHSSSPFRLLLLVLLPGVALLVSGPRFLHADEPPAAPEATPTKEATPETEESGAEAEKAVKENKPKQPAANPLGRLFRGLIGRKRNDGRMIPANEDASPLDRRFGPRDRIDGRVPQDLELTKQLRRTADYVANKEWDAAERAIRHLIEQSAGMQVRDEAGRWVPLHDVASRLLTRFPPSQFEAYRRTYGSTAESILREARSEGSMEKLALVARRYFHTDAGYEAANELGSRHLDRGEYGIAARWFERLIEAKAMLTRDPVWRMKAAFALDRTGNPEAANKLLDEQPDSATVRTVELGGSPRDPRTWLSELRRSAAPSQDVLEEWPMLYGNASRTALETEGEPLLLTRWTHDVTRGERAQERIRELVLDLSDEGQPTLPSNLPLFVDGKVIFRTLNGVRVVDAKTGHSLWETPSRISFESLLGRQEGQNPYRAHRFRHANGSRMDEPLSRLLFGDGVNGLLSSDGRRLFLIEDQAWQFTRQAYNPWGGWNRAASNDVDNFGRSFSTNFLTAYDLSTGRPVWSIGGKLTDELFSIPLSGNYFFGPPVVAGNRLYVIGEKDERIVLHALDAATGMRAWSIPLAFSDTKIAEDVVRRNWVAQPSVAGGVIVCPTTVGWLVGVDATTHEALWFHRYTKPTPDENPSQQPTNATRAMPRNSRWHASAPVIVGDHVLFTPPEETKLICVGLYDGIERWSIDKREYLHLAGVVQGRVLLLGKRSVAAFSVESGHRQWSVRIPTEAGLPSGRGVATAKHFYLPLDSGQVWSIDVTQGTVSNHWFLSPDGPPLENLGMYRGMLLSVGIRRVTAFEQRAAVEQDILARLERDPHDPLAILKQAEIRMLGRKYEQAIESLRSIPSDEVPAALRSRYRTAMIETLIAIVRSAPRDHDAELEELGSFVQSPDEKLQYERLRGLYLTASDEHVAAFELFSRLAGTDDERMLPRHDDGRVTLRESLWVTGQLADAWERLTEKQKAELAPDILAAARAAEEGNRTDREAFLQRYGFHSAANRVRFQLAESAAADGNFAIASDQLLRMTRSTDRSVAAEAFVRMVELMRRFGAPRDADFFLRRLADRYSDSSLPDETPVVEELRRLGWNDAQASANRNLDEAVDNAENRSSANSISPRPLLVQAPDWGEFDLELVQIGGQSSNAMVQQIAPDELPTPYFQAHRFEFSPSSRHLGIIDHNDESLDWLVPLRSTEQQSQSVPVSKTAGLRLAVLHGNVLHMLSPIDRRILWTRPIDSSTGGAREVAHTSGNSHAMKRGTGLLSERSLPSRNEALGPIPVCNEDYVAVRERRGLDILDALTGELRWKLTGLANGTRICGTSRMVFVIPVDGEAFALRSSDGKRIEIDELRRLLDRTFATTPRGLLLMENRAKRNLLNLGGVETSIRLYDPLADRDLWKREFPGNAYIDTFDEGLLAALDDEGHLDLLDLETGLLERLESGIDEQDLKRTESVVALADDRRVFLFLNRSDRGNQIYSGNLPHATANGSLVAVDRATGKPAWKRSVASQNVLLPCFRHMPVLLFAIRHFDRNGQVHVMTTKILAIDRGTGRTLIKESFLNNNGFQSVSIDMRNRNIEFASYNGRIRLRAVPRKPASQEEDRKAADDD